MAENNFSQVYTDDMLNQASQKLVEIKNLFYGMVTLTGDERKSLNGVGERTEPFIDKGLYYGGRNAAFVPSFVNFGVYQSNVKNIKLLELLQKEVTELQNLIDDTLLLNDSVAYDGALAIYKTIQQAAAHKVAGAQEAADDMGARFPGRKAAAPAPATGK
jgi:hypothetical protein